MVVESALKQRELCKEHNSSNCVIFCDVIICMYIILYWSVQSFPKLLQIIQFFAALVYFCLENSALFSEFCKLWSRCNRRFSTRTMLFSFRNQRSNHNAQTSLWFIIGTPKNKLFLSTGGTPKPVDFGASKASVSTLSMATVWWYIVLSENVRQTMGRPENSLSFSPQCPTYLMILMAIRCQIRSIHQFRTHPCVQIFVLNSFCSSCFTAPTWFARSKSMRRQHLSGCGFYMANTSYYGILWHSMAHLESIYCRHEYGA